MVNENDFYNVLVNIARSLDGINKNLTQINSNYRNESVQNIKESKKRMQGNRTLLNESKKKSIENFLRSKGILKENQHID